MDPEAGRLLRRFADYPAGSDHLVPEDLRRRPLLHLSARCGVSEPALREDLPGADLLSRTRKLPLALHGRLAGQCAGPVAGADRLGKDSPLADDLAAAILGDDGQRLLARHQQSGLSQNPLRGKQSRPAEYLFGSPGPLQFAHRAAHQQEGAAEILNHHRRAPDNLLPGAGQPHRHGPFEPRGCLPGLSGLLAVGARLRRQGGEGDLQHRGQYLLGAGGGRYGPHALRPFRQDRPTARVAVRLE